MSLGDVFYYACLVSAVLALFLVVLVVVYRDRAIGTRARPDLATPKGYPLIGNLRQIMGKDRQLEAWLDMTTQQYEKDPSKVISITAPGIRVIDITRPDWIQHVQSKAFTNYAKGSMFHDNMDELLGDGIFNSDGAHWYQMRKSTSKIFTGANFRGIITECLENGIDKLKKVVGQYADSGQPFDLQDLFFRFTLDTFCKMSFGTDVGALTLDASKPVPFAQAFDKVQILINDRFNNPLWKITERLTGTDKKVKEYIKVMDDWAYSIIDERQRQGKDNIAAGQKRDAVDLLSLYMSIRDENGQAINRKGLRDALLNLTFAGRDTTAQALSWQFFWLIKNWSYALQIRQQSDGAPVNYDNYKSHTTAYSCFNETLRLRPSVPKNGWIALGDDELPNDGPLILKGDLVRWGTLQMGYFKHVWGPDAAEWKPERWIDDESGTPAVRNEPAHKFHAFNSGKRLCLGVSLATYEAVAVTSALINAFDFEFEPGYIKTVPMALGTPMYSETLTLPQKYPFMVIAKHRKS